MMQLSADVRSSMKKGDLKQMRREGKVPAVLYSGRPPSQPLLLEGSELSKILRTMKPGHLGTTVFHLKVNGQEKRTIVKDIQYQLTTYQVSHVDFEELFEAEVVRVKVPIQCVGVAECVGIKLGGFLRQVIRHVKVECLPRAIPSEFLIDIRNLGIKEAKKLSDIDIPQGVRPFAKMDEVVVVVGKRSA